MPSAKELMPITATIEWTDRQQQLNGQTATIKWTDSLEALLKQHILMRLQHKRLPQKGP